MSILSKLFGGKAASEPDPVEYNGYLIFPTPMKEGGKFRISARIEKDIGGDLKIHTLIRADTFESADAAAEAAIFKAKLMVDQQGDAIFK